MVAARYAPFVGGIETHIHEVGVRMAALGHQVVVLTTDPSGHLPSEEMAGGMLVKRVKAWPKDRDYYFAPRIYQEVQSQDCDIIHFQGYNTFVAPVGMLAASRRGIPFVLTFHSGGHSSGLRNSVRGLQQTILAPLASRASRLIGVSEFEADYFSHKMKVARARFSVVPNGASLPPPSDPPPPLDPHLVLSVGRLERYKGHHRAIEAFPTLLRSVPDARLQIVGSGPYEAELRQLVTALNLEGVVSFVSIPSAERQRLTDLLCSAGLVVLLSEYEAHPVAVMEALSVNRPVLVCDTSGLREIAKKGWCRSIPLASSPDQVAKAIQDQLYDQYRAADVTLPNWDNCAENLIDIYQAAA